MEKKSTRVAYGETLVKLGKINKDIVVLEADLSKSTMTAYFQKEFPERHINIGIAEADMIATAAGIATTGKIAFASTFAHFAAGRAFDQIRNSVAYTQLNVNIPVLFDEDYTFEIGKAVTLTQGDDVAILATGLMVSEALKAEKLLEEKGIKARVINVSTIKPLDTETVLKAAKECKFIVTSEEHSVIGGLGSAVSEYLSEVHPTKVIKHGIQDIFGQSADGETMLTNYGLRAENIVELVLKNM